jgi:alkyl hydroperoxide reductase subunit AhpF
MGGLTMPKPLWDEETGAEIAEVLSDMTEPVRLLLFVEDDECAPCQTQRSLLEGVAALSDKLSLEIVSPEERRETVDAYGIDRFPATLPLGEKDYGIRFFGVTGGREFASFLQAIMMISTGRSGLPTELEPLVREIQRPVHIQIFVTLTCP